MKISFKNLSIGYGSKKVLENLNFEFESTETICLLGPNGIGKTTFFKTLLGFLSPLQGDILIDGVSIKKMNSKQIASIFSYVPQAKDYSYQFTVEEVILMGRALYIKKFSSPSEEDYKVVNRVMKELGIEQFRNKIYSELSGGEQQIVLIARALAQESKFIIMDEPASNLDFLNQKKMLDTIINLRKLNIGILMSTHTPDHAFICADYAILIFKSGKYTYGLVDDIIKTDNLTQAYDVNIKVLENQSDGEIIKTCSLVGGRKDEKNE